MARGDIPPESEWTWHQAAAITAFLDGHAEPRNGWAVKTTDCGFGHREVCIARVWVDPWKALCARLFNDKKDRGEGDRQLSAERAARRAKSKVRQLVKGLGCNSLGTLTYQANQTDRDLCLKHWKEFIRRVRKVLPSFAYVAIPEKQKRGAYHIHIAMRKLPPKIWMPAREGQAEGWVKSWDVMRAIWRRVIGGGGTFNENRSGRGVMARMMKIAGYIGKYVAKGFADDAELNKKRYFASDLPQPSIRRDWHDEAELTGLIAAAYGELAGAALEECATMLPTVGNFFWMSIYAPPEGPPPR